MTVFQRGRIRSEPTTRPCIAFTRQVRTEETEETKKGGQVSAGYGLNERSTRIQTSHDKLHTEWHQSKRLLRKARPNYITFYSMIS